mmetsp:Transcript_48366/g.142736  ORF Transcript_48366/g.142736 Transcript_48366/m.142736 type:complete len:686 (-) Transcript_48366:983-3040(-)
MDGIGGALSAAWPLLLAAWCEAACVARHRARAALPRSLRDLIPLEVQLGHLNDIALGAQPDNVGVLHLKRRRGRVDARPRASTPSRCRVQADAIVLDLLPQDLPRVDEGVLVVVDEGPMENEDLRVHDESPGEVDLRLLHVVQRVLPPAALLLPCWRASFPVLGLLHLRLDHGERLLHVEPLENLLDALDVLVGCPEAEVPQHRQVEDARLVGHLEHAQVAGDEDDALRGEEHARQHLQERRLAAAMAADNRDNLPLRHGDVHIGQQRLVRAGEGEGEVDALDRDEVGLELYARLDGVAHRHRVDVHAPAGHAADRRGVRQLRPGAERLEHLLGALRVRPRRAEELLPGLLRQLALPPVDDLALPHVRREIEEPRELPQRPHRGGELHQRPVRDAQLGLQLVVDADRRQQRAKREATVEDGFRLQHDVPPDEDRAQPLREVVGECPVELSVYVGGVRLRAGAREDVDHLRPLHVLADEAVLVARLVGDGHQLRRLHGGLLGQLRDLVRGDAHEDQHAASHQHDVRHGLRILRQDKGQDHSQLSQDRSQAEDLHVALHHLRAVLGQRHLDARVRDERPRVVRVVQVLPEEVFLDEPLRPPCDVQAHLHHICESQHGHGHDPQEPDDVCGGLASRQQEASLDARGCAEEHVDHVLVEDQGEQHVQVRELTEQHEGEGPLLHARVPEV